MDFDKVCPYCGAEKSFVYCCGFKGYWTDGGDFRYTVPVPGNLEWRSMNPNVFNWRNTVAPVNTLPIIEEETV
jgi:hypothetical protein